MTVAPYSGGAEEGHRVADAVGAEQGHHVALADARFGEAGRDPADGVDELRVTDRLAGDPVDEGGPVAVALGVAENGVVQGEVDDADVREFAVEHQGVPPVR